MVNIFGEIGEIGEAGEMGFVIARTAKQDEANQKKRLLRAVALATDDKPRAIELVRIAEARRRKAKPMTVFRLSRFTQLPRLHGFADLFCFLKKFSTFAHLML